MKALELTVYPRRGRETYVLPHPRLCLGATAVDRLCRAKRLTDAELAAEFWAASTDASRLLGNARRGGKTHAANVAMTLHRFATLSSYDEVIP